MRICQTQEISVNDPSIVGGSPVAPTIQRPTLEILCEEVYLQMSEQKMLPPPAQTSLLHGPEAASHPALSPWSHNPDRHRSHCAYWAGEEVLTLSLQIHTHNMTLTHARLSSPLALLF